MKEIEDTNQCKVNGGKNRNQWAEESNSNNNNKNETNTHGGTINTESHPIQSDEIIF